MGKGIQFGVNHRLAQKRWSNQLTMTAPKESLFFEKGLVGDEDAKNTPITVKEDLKVNPGTQLTYGLLDPLFMVSTVGDDILEGKEKDADYNDGVIYIGQERIAQKTGGRLDETRVPYKVRENMRHLQAQWWGEHFDEVFITKLSGSMGVNDWNTIDSTTIEWDNNVLNAPATDRSIVGTTLNAAKTSLTNSMTFSLDNIDACLKIAMRQSASSSRRKLRPMKIGGLDLYVMIIDYLAYEQLLQATSGRFYDAMKAEIAGGSKALQESNIWRMADFKYRNVLVHVHEELVRFDDYGGGGTYKAVRNLFLGAQAGHLVLGPGESGSKSGFYWKERKIDYENKLGVATGKIWGFDKCRFSTSVGGNTYQDYGVITVDTYVGSF